jgi:sugar/nucleoside kinase (ribokinase family)
MTRRPVIGSMGELLVEFLAEAKDGRHLAPGRYRGPYPSGAPGIFIDQAARAGARAIFSGAVGQDAFGEVILARLAAAGVADTLLRRMPLPTGTAFVSYNSDGSRDFVYNIAHSAAALAPSGAEAVAAFRAAGTEVFHISGSALGEAGMRGRILGVARALAESGTALSLDPNIRKELLGDPAYLADLRALLAQAALILPSEDDAVLLFPGEGFAEWSARLLAQGARAVALKRGAEGALAREKGGEVLALPAHKVDVIDPTGAGDAFCGAFVARLAGGAPLAQALAEGNAAGALAVGRLGPMEGTGNFADIAALLALRPFP